MKSMLIHITEFLGEKARGLLLTLGGFGIGSAPEIVSKGVQVSMPDDLKQLQMWVFIGTLVVAGLTTISYLYKFYKWLSNNKKFLKIFKKK